MQENTLGLDKDQASHYLVAQLCRSLIIFPGNRLIQAVLELCK